MNKDKKLTLKSPITQISVLKTIKWLALACTIGALVTMVLLLNRHQSSSTHPSPPSKKTMMEMPVIIENRGEQVRWKLRAAKAEQGLQEMHLINPILEIYSEDGSAIPIQGDAAWFNPIKRSARFVGNVTIDYQQWHLQSAEAVFDGSSGKLHITGKFTAHGDHVTMRGENLTVDQPRKCLEVRHHIKIEDQR